MTFQEAKDRIAELLGHTRCQKVSSGNRWHWPGEVCDPACNGGATTRTPFSNPENLSALMPNGWKMYSVGWEQETVEASAIFRADSRVVRATGSTEIEARTLLLLDVLEYEKRRTATVHAPIEPCLTPAQIASAIASNYADRLKAKTEQLVLDITKALNEMRTRTAQEEHAATIVHLEAVGIRCVCVPRDELPAANLRAKEGHFFCDDGKSRKILGEPVLTKDGAVVFSGAEVFCPRGHKAKMFDRMVHCREGLCRDDGNPTAPPFDTPSGTSYFPSECYASHSAIEESETAL